MANAALVSLATRQQVLLERLKAGDAKKLEAFLKEAATAIRNKLAGENLTALSRARAEAQLKAISDDLTAIYANAGRQITSDLKELADYTAGAEVRALESVLIDGVEMTIPPANQVYAAAIARPMTSGKSAVMMEALIRDWSASSVKAVENSIRLGFFSGKTNQELVQEIIGTKANKYQDGIIDLTRRNAQTVVRTAVQHVAQVARNEVFAQNADIVNEYEWVSTLDSRTSDQCRALDGQTFPVGKGPLPPIHYGCRSSVAPVISNKYIRETLREGATRSAAGGPVSANLSYYEWLKTQPASFQNEAMGPVKAKLLRDGGLSAQRFQELQLGKNFEPLTLAEMERLEPVAFNRAGLEVTDGGVVREKPAG